MKFRTPGAALPSAVEKEADFSTNRVVRILPQVPASIDVFRAALVSIVLTLTLGQNAAVLCGVGCDPGPGANGACDHQIPMTAPGVTGNESCVGAATEPAAIREDIRESASASDAHQGTVVALFQFAPRSISSAQDLERAQAAFAARPLVRPLRI